MIFPLFWLFVGGVDLTTQAVKETQVIIEEKLGTINGIGITLIAFS